MPFMHLFLQENPIRINKMDMEEIDAWYEEEKEKIFNVYLQNKESKKNHEKAEKLYKESMNKTRKKYSEMYEKSNKPNLIKKYSAKIKESMDKLKKKR